MKPRSRKKGLIPLLLIFLICLSGCQTPSAQSSFLSSSQESSSATESNLEQSSIDESESSLEQSSQEDSSQEDSSSEEQSSIEEPPHEHSPLPDDGDCTTPIVCSCNHVMILGKQAHHFDNACDTSCNNDNCTHVRRVGGHKDTDNNGKCDYCSADVPKNGGFELPEDSFH